VIQSRRPTPRPARSSKRSKRPPRSQRPDRAVTPCPPAADAPGPPSGWSRYSREPSGGRRPLLSPCRRERLRMSAHAGQQQPEHGATTAKSVRLCRGERRTAVGATKAAGISSVGTIPITSAIEKRGWASSAHGNKGPGRRPPGRRPARPLHGPDVGIGLAPGFCHAFPRLPGCPVPARSDPPRRRAGDYAGQWTPRTPVDARPADHDATGADSRPAPPHLRGDPCRAPGLRARNPGLVTHSRPRTPRPRSHPTGYEARRDASGARSRSREHRNCWNRGVMLTLRLSIRRQGSRPLAPRSSPLAGGGAPCRPIGPRAAVERTRLRAARRGSGVPASAPTPAGRPFPRGSPGPVTESRAAAFGEDARGQSPEVRPERLAVAVQQPGFAMVIADLEVCGFGPPPGRRHRLPGRAAPVPRAVRGADFGRSGFDRALPPVIGRITGGCAFAFAGLLVHPPARHRDEARQLQEPLLSERQASLGVALADRGDEPVVASLRFWRRKDVGSLCEPADDAVFPVLVLPLIRWSP
jgi:hypothetical protein